MFTNLTMPHPVSLGPNYPKQTRKKTQLVGENPAAMSGPKDLLVRLADRKESEDTERPGSARDTPAPSCGGVVQ